MVKRFQVFVSSTYSDLVEERNEVIKALLELDCIPCGMEYFPAANETQWNYIKQLIDDCDYYIVIIGGRYGSEDEDGVSFTQKEYEYAVSVGIPVVGFIHNDPKQLPGIKLEDNPEGRKKLEKFKETVKKRLCKFWANPAELGGLVSRSMIQEIKRNPRTGWVKADTLTSEDANKEIIRLRKINDKLMDELNLYKLKGPDGSDNLAQDEEIYLIEYYEYDLQKVSDVYYPRYQEIKREEKKLETNWNEIFYWLAPKVGQEAPKSLFTTLATKTLINILSSKKLIELENELKKFKISSESSETILIQFQALGYILEFLREVDGNNGRKVKKLIRLTDIGEKKLIQLRAIKKVSSKNEYAN